MVLVSDNGKITRFRLVAVVALVAIHSLAPPMYNWAGESDKQQFSGNGGHVSLVGMFAHRQNEVS